MTMRRIAFFAVLAGLIVVGRPKPDNAPGDPVLSGGETTLAAVARENFCELPESEARVEKWPEWSSTDMKGGDITPVRRVVDPNPTFHSVAVDEKNNRVLFSDSNQRGLLVYDRLAQSTGRDTTLPLTEVRGPAAGMMFIAGVAVDPDRHELFTVNNDIGDRMVVFPYDAEGNARPLRVLHVPHQSWGLSLNPKREEMAITVESPNLVVFYKHDAEGEDQPLHRIQGRKTGLADPHGVFVDPATDEVFVANHGNWNVSGLGRGRQQGERAGRFDQPSIRVFNGTVDGDQEPMRVIQGAKTGLNWPMGLDVDVSHREIAVANNGDSSIRFFPRDATGDVAPSRVLKGPRTLINEPMGLTIDETNGELWVANYGDHTALVFDRTASGNVPPKRIIRNAPAGTPTAGFGNPGAIAYDSKRNEILVPN